jgi:hypothetical protein
MILRHQADVLRNNRSEVRPAWQIFLDAQKAAAPAGMIALQIAHSALAGQLAAHLTESAFGRLPREVVEAAARHDLGWAESDERQLKQNTPRALRPFLEMKQDELPSWRRSLEMATQWPPLTQVLISRHFSALANQPSPAHEEFLRMETARRAILERELGYSAEDLNRWAGAVGVCDLLSLYLCSGSRETAEFPLAHPAEPDAGAARKFTVAWSGGRPVFSWPVFRQGAELHLGSLRISEGGELEPASLRWTL